jgi:iron-sulfur cluster assembly protein
MQNIISVTEEAQTRLRELISSNESAIGVRIEILSGGCAGFKYKFSYLTALDLEESKLVEYDGLKILLDNQSCSFLDGSELDYVVENFGSRFVFNSPTMTKKCGCGKSFGV